MIQEPNSICQIHQTVTRYIFYRNRVVTISGPHQAVATAKYLIEKRIQEEDESRLTSTSNNSSY